MPDHGRSFIALTPNRHGRDVLHELGHTLTATLRIDRRARWSVPGDLHLTLRFLGTINATQQILLNSSLAASVDAGIRLQPTALTLWPHPEHARVLVLLLRDDPALQRIAQAAEAIAREAGFAAETRPFTPHITLARLHGGTLRIPPVALPEPFVAERLGLFASGPADADGRRYHELHGWPLPRP